MVEPEMAFCDLYGDMDMAEEFVRFLVGDALDVYKRQLPSVSGPSDIFAGPGRNVPSAGPGRTGVSAPPGSCS